MDGVVAGMFGFLGMATLFLVVVTYSRVTRLQQQVQRIAIHLGVDLTAPPALSDRVKELATDPARKIEAIKVLREETGVGLAEAKDAVEAYQRTLGR